MPKTKISEFSATPGNNTDIDGINISEGCAPSGINDAIRELMAQLKDFQAGTAGDSFNGPVGTTTPAAGTFTNLSASGTFALTGDQVQISEGGTGQTTANAAFNALAPSQSTHAGKYLKTDGTNTSWDALDISTADITGTLPIANGGTGLTALGTGVQTALGIAVGSSGAFVTNGGALGTPSSGTVTNLTGTASININGTVGATTPTTGAFTTLSASGNITVSGGTANGVAYLNGSKVLTTGSALQFDGSRLGVGISPTQTIDANGAVLARSNLIAYTALVLQRSSSSLELPVAAYTNGSGNILASNTKGDIVAFGNVGGDGVIFANANLEAMRLTSTGLGIGTSSPAQKLEVSGGAAQFNGGGIDGTFGDAILFGNTTFSTVQKNRIRSSISAGAASNLLSIETGTGTTGAYNANQLVLVGDGNIGIGTGSPTEKLTVNGNIKLGTSGTTYIYGPATTGRSFFSNSDSTAYIGVYGSAYGAGQNSIIQFVAGTTNSMTFDSSGNLGLGVTPSAWNANNKSIIQLQNTANFFTRSTGLLATSNVVYNSADTGVFQANGYGVMYQQNQTAGTHVWLNTPNNTSGAGATASLTSAMTLDASGYLLVGTTTSPSQQAVIYRTSATTSNGALLLDGNGNYAGLQFATSGTLKGSLSVDNTALYLTHGSTLTFRTGDSTNVGGTERARITSGGYFKASNDGTYLGSTGGYHELRSNTDNNNAVIISSNATNGTQYGLSIRTTNDQNDATRDFLECQGGGVLRAQFRTNGGLANYSANNVNLSDQRLKTDAQPAGNYLDKICAIPIKTFLYKDQTDTERNLGVMAQDVDAVAPELIDHNGFGETPEGESPYLAVYQTDLQYALMKCIQELKAQNDDLRARVAQLEAK